MQTEPRSLEPSNISEKEKPFEPHYPYEEVANSVSHGLGMLAAIVASVFMLMKATAPAAHLSDGQVAGVAVYGGSMILLFLSSTLYHSAVDPARKAMFNRIDHCAIYLLIAGSYTPFLMITLKTTLAEVLLVIIWALAVAGIVFKIFFIDKFPRTSLATYLLMGWLSIIAIYQLYQVAQMPLVYLLIAGGVSYSVGTIFYAINKIPYNHAIWHIFVLAGAALHCLAIWQYVIPS